MFQDFQYRLSFPKRASLQIPFKLWVSLQAINQAIASTSGGGGKSGQHRATHRLTTGPDRKIRKKVPQKITVLIRRDKGENVR